MKKKNLLFFIVLVICVLTSCTKTASLPAPAEGTPAPEPTYTIVQPTAIPKTLWIDPALKAFLDGRIEQPAGWQLVTDKNDAHYWIDMGGEHPATNLVFALVAPFPTISDDISMTDFVEIWKQGISVTSKFHQLLMDQQTLQLLSRKLGTPIPNLIEILPADQLLAAAWNTTGAWAVVPFEQLVPRWKVISIDEISPIHKNFAVKEYLLNFDISIEPNPLLSLESMEIPLELTAWIPSNRDADKITTLIMTGVTALVRATAATMEVRGMTYPALNIGDLLRSADITHVSNEIAFSPTCPRPHYQGDLLEFCSRPEYIQLLEFIGTDVVDMTGDHFIDVQPEDVLYTLKMYADRGWGYFAAGANIDEARAALYKTMNSTSIAFIGCNAKSRAYALASTTHPGAVHCDWEYLDRELPLIVEKGYLPVMTFSHIEYYQYEALPDLVVDFHRAADDGAVIVSGSQGHQPQAMEFYKDSFLHYGLGNLFFDQYLEGLAERQAFIDRHVFYDGKYISTELFTIQFIDFAQTRFMTPKERADLLRTIFTASDWHNINP